MKSIQTAALLLAFSLLLASCATTSFSVDERLVEDGQFQYHIDSSLLKDTSRTHTLDIDLTYRTRDSKASSTAYINFTLDGIADPVPVSAITFLLPGNKTVSGTELKLLIKSTQAHSVRMESRMGAPDFQTVLDTIDTTSKIVISEGSETFVFPLTAGILKKISYAKRM